MVEGLTEPLTGFENHMGATVLGPDARPLSRVKYGVGNSVPAGSAVPDTGLVDGVVQGSIVATYMHGPCLARNPQLADYLVAQVLGVPAAELEPLEIPAITLLRKERLAAAKHPFKRTA